MRRWSLVLRTAGVIALLLVLAAFLLREDLRDFVVDDTRYGAEIALAAHRYGLDPQLVRSVVFRESRFDPYARGKAGEVGLMQVLPEGAAAEWGRLTRRPVPGVNDLYDVRTNLDVGCWYLALGMRKYSGYRHGVELALARYNAGESRSEKWKPEDPAGEVVGRISIPSTREYVERIMRRYRHYTGI